MTHTLRPVSSEQRQLHPLLSAPARRPDSDCGRRGEHSVHLGSGHADSSDQGGADVLGAGVLRSGHQPRLQGLLLLLLRRKHRCVGSPQPDPGQVRRFAICAQSVTIFHVFECTCIYSIYMDIFLPSKPDWLLNHNNNLFYCYILITGETHSSYHVTCYFDLSLPMIQDCVFQKWIWWNIIILTARIITLITIIAFAKDVTVGSCTCQRHSQECCFSSLCNKKNLTASLINSPHAGRTCAYRFIAANQSEVCTVCVGSHSCEFVLKLIYRKLQDANNSDEIRQDTTR